MFHLASPVMFNKIPKSSLKLQVPVFSQNWIHLRLNSNARRLVCQTVIVIVIWLICYGKQNNGNLKYVLKQDSSYSLYIWLDYNNLSSSICSGNLFLCFRPHYGIFPTLLQVRTAVFKIMYVLSNALVPVNAQNLTISYLTISICISLYINIKPM